MEPKFWATEKLVRKAIDEHVFPGASFALVIGNKPSVTCGAGSLTYALESSKVTQDTSFDLASLTKVIATTTVAMVLYEKGALVLDGPIADVVPEFAAGNLNDSRRQAVTFRMLLAHSSGLPAHRRFFDKAENREELLK